MDAYSEILFFCWLFIFALLIPTWKYRSALAHGVGSHRLMLLTIILLFIPACLGVYALLAYLNISTVDLAFSPKDFSSPIEFFAARDKVHAPYVTVVLSLFVIQIALILVVTSLTKVARVYAMAIGFAGFHIAVIFGVLALNLLLGQWPST